MADYNITLDEQMVRELFLSSYESGALKDLLTQVLNQILEGRAQDLCGAALYEQTDERKDYRNGYRDRSLLTRFGKIELAVPRLRGQSVLGEGLIENYSRSEQALMAGVAEMVISGVSSRKVDAVALTLFGESISKSQVSRVVKMLDPVVEEFRQRPLDEYYPFLIVDAMYIDVRKDGTPVSKALYIAIAINTSGRREIVGIAVCDRESKESYREFFKSIKERGLERIDLAVSDSHEGLVEALKAEFLGASWQRCQTHFSKNMRDKCPKKVWGEAKEMLTAIYTARNIEEARRQRDEALFLLVKEAPKAAELLDSAFDDVTAVFSIPLKYRKKLRTSNMIERLNEEIRRRERPIRIFTNDDSVIRILGTVAMEIHDKWAVERVLFDMGEYFGPCLTSVEKTSRDESERRAA